MRINLILSTVLLLLVLPGYAQKKKPVKSDTIEPTTGLAREQAFAKRQSLENESLVKNVEFRCVGPTIMSGRVVDVDVDPKDPTHFYVAYASGGLWETTNNGTSFDPLFDHEAVITIGDIAVDWSHGEVIWVGTGEVNSSRSSYSGMGVYKSTDHGKSWKHCGLDDSQHIGKIVLHPDDPLTAWVAVLGHLYTPSGQRGVYKTTDGGTTWQLVLGPADLQLPMMASNQLFSLGMNTGVVDLVIDPLDPKQLFAATWTRTRSAWNFQEAGSGSAIYHSTDGGTNWKKITMGNGIGGNGFPADTAVGRIGLAIAHTSSAHVLYAFLDNQAYKTEDKKDEDKGLKKEIFRTMTPAEFAKLVDKDLEAFLRNNDFPKEHSAESVKKQVAAGNVKPIDLYDYLFEASAIFYEKPVTGAQVYTYDFDASQWHITHEKPLDDVVFSYGYYFGLIRVSPTNSNKLYIAGVPLITSDDGGKNWHGINPNNVHVDHHALWIDPVKPGHLINGSDGGIQISYDDGATWVNRNTPSVGQFYSVAVDNAKPYNVYGGLQDNGVWVGPSDNEPSRDWYQNGRYPFEFLMGGDGMQVQVDTRDNKTVYTGYQFGQYSRLHREEGFENGIHPMHKLGEKPLRWNWQAPILLSKHHQDIFYICSNKVHRSLDQGKHFETLSGDLTQGGRVGDVPYGTLTSISESPLRFGWLVVGSDDGLINLSTDNGYTWTRISDALPQNLWVSRVVFSAYMKERIYVTLNGYRNDHFKAYVFASDDLGKTWKNISGGLPEEPVNVIREDFTNENILYVGTDYGLYMSIDRGGTWMKFGCNMPTVAVHDIALQERDKDIVLGTHGRSIWIGDLEEVQQLPLIKDSVFFAFDPEVVSFNSGWGSNWSQWLKPEEPKFSIPVYSREGGSPVTVIVSLGDSLELNRFETTVLGKGIQYLPYDLTLTEEKAHSLVDALNAKRKEDEKEIKIEKADNGLFYLTKAKYTLTLVCNGTIRKKELVLE